MIDYESMRKTVVSGLKSYLQTPVIRANQNESPPTYPFVSYTITTLESENKGTWQEHDDGTDRKPVTQIWSISALSNDNSESVALASIAREWLDRSGTVYLNDNNVIVQSTGSITNRDNFLTVEYEHKNGFDVVFWLYDEVKKPDNGYIEEVTIGENTQHATDYNEMLEKRLDGELR